MTETETTAAMVALVVKLVDRIATMLDDEYNADLTAEALMNDRGMVPGLSLAEATAAIKLYDAASR